MNHDDQRYLTEMLDYAHRILSLPGSSERHIFDTDITQRVTITHWLQIIGEAARHVSDEYQLKHTEVPWRAMTGMRNRIVHDYLGVDDEVVWETASLRIPELIALLEKLLTR